jgi:hypothetical protein
MIIEIISIPDYPNRRPALELVKDLLASESLVADVREVFGNRRFPCRGSTVCWLHSTHQWQGY